MTINNPDTNYSIWIFVSKTGFYVLIRNEYTKRSDDIMLKIIIHQPDII